MFKQNPSILKVFSADVKFLLNQSREAKFAITSFLLIILNCGAANQSRSAKDC